MSAYSQVLFPNKAVTMLSSIKNKISRGLSFRKDIPYLVRAVAYAILFAERKSKYIPNEAELKRLLRNGMTLLPNENLLPETVARLRNKLESMRSLTKKDENNNILKKIYEPADLVNDPAFLELALRDEVLGLAERYLQCTPKIAFVAAWTVYADSEQDVGEMFFHMDHHGHKFLKLFYYLSDVEIGGGHHEFVSGSHDSWSHKKDLAQMKKCAPELYSDVIKKKRLKGGFRLDNQMIIRYFKDRIIKIAGNKGTCFVEDTYGLHRGTPIENGVPRTVFQVLYVPTVLEKDQVDRVDCNFDLVLGATSEKLSRDYYFRVSEHLLNLDKTV
jgi:hypothetical protein